MGGNRPADRGCSRGTIPGQEAARPGAARASPPDVIRAPLALLWLRPAFELSAREPARDPATRSVHQGGGGAMPRGRLFRLKSGPGRSRRGCGDRVPPASPQTDPWREDPSGARVIKSKKQQKSGTGRPESRESRPPWSPPAGGQLPESGCCGWRFRRPPYGRQASGGEGYPPAGGRRRGALRTSESRGGVVGGGEPPFRRGGRGSELAVYRAGPKWTGCRPGWVRREC